MDRRERLDDAEESLRLALEGQIAGLWTATPAIVVGVDLAKQTLSVQPAIQGKIADPSGSESDVNLPLLVDVPIIWPRAGGFALTFPIAAGDEVLVVFASRCIDTWWQSGGIGVQAEVRMHDLSDGFAILAPTSQPKVLPNVSSTSAQLRDEVGTTFLEITPDGRINLTAITEINMEAPIININAATELNLTSATINQTASAEINMEAPALNIEAAVIANGGQTLDGIVFGTHVHIKDNGNPHLTLGPDNP